MNQDLDHYLIDKYPLIFRDRYASMRETAMCWGFACGDGWFDLIDVLCELCTRHLDQHPELATEFRAVQVKEKFGALRFYVDCGDEYLYALTQAAEDLSEYVCEECGAPGALCKPTPSGCWIKCRCPEHGGPALKPIAPPRVEVPIEQWGEDLVNLHPGPHADLQALADLEVFLVRRPDMRAWIQEFSRAYEIFPRVAWLLQAILKLLGTVGMFKSHQELPLAIREVGGNPVFEIAGTADEEVRATFDFFLGLFEKMALQAHEEPAGCSTPARSLQA